MKEALRAYFEKNKSLPERIIVYRDGVGDGMLGAVVVPSPSLPSSPLSHPPILGEP